MGGIGEVVGATEVSVGDSVAVAAGAVLVTCVELVASPSDEQATSNIIKAANKK